MCVLMMSHYQEMIKLWLSLVTNHCVSVVFVQHVSCLVVHGCRALIRSMTMKKAKRVRADGLGAVKDGHGGLD